MKKIINGFLKKEVQRFGLSMTGFILCLIAVSVIPEVRPLLPIFAVAFSVIIILALSASVARFLQSKADIHSLSDNETIMLEQQYATEHPIYKVAYGEIHLLHDFIISRNNSRLIVIPLSRIKKVDERFRRAGIHRVPYITFVLDTGKHIPVDFSSRHYKDGEPVINWLIERIGMEKVERGTEKSSILR
ncbi:hypothetical protein [Anaerotruncus colihominis]|uniref:hypothetical protein n=1 Tax=Anaerotruncus colihominis TaxID=169435 RepID=UPI001896B443|nr:hypothetical protein [Anaerotruncus colihominis]